MIDPFEYPNHILDEICSPYFEEQIDNYDEYDKEFNGGVSDIDTIDDVIYHEKLKFYQQYLASFSEEKLPSKNKQVWWLYAESRRKKRQPTKDSGKWLIFCPPDQIDAAWEQIKDATEKGQLGKKSKVSTLKGYKGKDHVICVYTYNWKDEKDVMKIRNTLRELGFEKPLSYKSDADTLAGRYENKGHKNIAKYYE